VARSCDSSHEVCCDANALLYMTRPRISRVPTMFVWCDQTTEMRSDGGGALQCVDAREGAMLA
jgi:hypothetical protein